MKFDGVTDSILVECDCHTHQIQIDRDECETEDGIIHKSFMVSVWELIGNSPLSFRQRVRWCWRILRTGMPWSDMVIITDEKAKEMSQFINKHVS